jgi:putative N6-adenine-specific DNA methylase
MGVESLLQEELAPLLAHLPLSVVVDRGGVRVHSNQPAGRAPIDLPFDFESSLAATVVEAVFIINLHSRLAQRVLWRVALGPYASEDQIYHLARCVDWNDWITPEHTLRVDVTARHSPLQSLNFAGLRIKDAVCDALRDQHGERPSVDLRHPDLQLQLHLDENAAYLYVDTSGEALFKRGWREDTGEAPLKETLAAAMLAAAGWKGRAEDGALLDPCCGSGTIAIEAAQIACGMAAGMLRRFAFEQLSPFAPHEAIWTQLIAKAKAQVRAPAVRIYTGDVSFRMTDFATRNAERAGVMHAIEFKTADALQRMPPEETGLMMFNPPYGERIDPKGTGHGGQREARAVREDFTERDAGDFFSRMASHWKKNYPGWTAWVLSPDMKLPSAMRLKESRRTVMFNGPIECRLFRFDLVAGSLRSDAAQSGAGGEHAAAPRRPQVDPDED